MIKVAIILDSEINKHGFGGGGGSDPVFKLIKIQGSNRNPTPYSLENWGPPLCNIK